MAGSKAGATVPTDKTVHGQSRVLEIAFSDGARLSTPFELMRLHSPSAAVQANAPERNV